MSSTPKSSAKPVRVKAISRADSTFSSHHYRIMAERGNRSLERRQKQPSVTRAPTRVQDRLRQPHPLLAWLQALLKHFSQPRSGHSAADHPPR